MQQVPNSLVSSSFSRPGYLAEVTQALMHIRDTNASGRLSIRNSGQFGLAHLYFKRARLVHVTGDKHDGDEVLSELLSWSKGSMRFDSAVVPEYEDLTWQQASIFGRWLSFLELRGVVQGIPQARVNGLARRLTASLPQQPVALPDEIEHYEDYEAIAGARQWKHISGSIIQFFSRTLPPERRQQINLLSRFIARRVFVFMQQTGRFIQKLAQEFMQLLSTWTKQATEHKVNRTDPLAQTAQITIQSIEERVSHTAGQTASVSPRIRSIRPVHPASLPAKGDE